MFVPYLFKTVSCVQEKSLNVRKDSDDNSFITSKSKLKMSPFEIIKRFIEHIKYKKLIDLKMVLQYIDIRKKINVFTL